MNRVSLLSACLIPGRASARRHQNLSVCFPVILLSIRFNVPQQILKGSFVETCICFCASKIDNPRIMGTFYNV